MKFKVIKSSIDGLCGREDRYDRIEDVLATVSYSKGWKTKAQMHASIKKWAKNARPGSIFCTQASAIICVAVDRSEHEDDMCPYCDGEGMEYADINGVGGDLTQTVSCPHCHKKWIDVFVFSDRQEICI